MADTLLPDDPQTVQRLDSVAHLLEWMGAMPAPTRKRFVDALVGCSDATRQVVASQIAVIKNPRTTPAERQRALKTLTETLFPKSKNGARMQDLAPPEAEGATEDTQQAAFAQRLREVMEARRISQQELADRIGCSQPAISQLLNRQCRPQKKTILKLAEALNVQARELWPEIDVAEMLDAVASFQQDGYVMTEAEARALRDTSRPNRPLIKPKSLPTRRRS